MTTAPMATVPVAVPDRRPFVAAALSTGIATIVFVLWVVLDIGGARLTDAFDDIGELVAALCAAGACGVAARRADAGRTSWMLLGLSSLAWGIGEALWCYYDLVAGIEVPFPSWADAGFLTSVPLACAGLLLFPGSPRRTTHRVQKVLDGCVISTTLLFASWATVLGPLYRSHQGSIFKQTISLAYPMSDVVMLSLVIMLLAGVGGRGRVSLGLVMIGVAAFAVADSSFAYLTEVNNYSSGSFLDTGWVLGYFLVGLGALWAITPTSSPADDNTEASTVSLVAPYLPVLIVLAVTAVEILRGRRIEPVAWCMACALALLVLGRESLRLWDRGTDGDPAGADAPTVGVAVPARPDPQALVTGR